MSRQIALVRGINVGGHKGVAMADLRGLLASLGFAGARSLLQSGNLVFESGRWKGAALERLLEQETAGRLGVSVDYLVRTAEEWRTIIEGNPFLTEARRDPGHLVVMCLKSAPSAKDVKALEAANTGPERIRSAGRELYITYPAGIGRSKLTGALIERTLGVRGTARNWNTALKMADAVNAD